MPDTTTSAEVWSLIPTASRGYSGVAHRVRPVGEDRHRTECGRVLLGLTPQPAPDGHKRCEHCARQERAGGRRYRAMPPLYGRNLTTRRDSPTRPATPTPPRPMSPRSAPGGADV